jgi:hypothetical protein
VEDFSARIGLRDCLELYLFFQRREAELGEAHERFFSSLRSYLYERLSIEEMESPEELLKRL